MKEKSNIKIRAIEYNRKSTEGEDRQVLSLDAQHQANKRIVEYYNLKVVKTYRESRSASKPHNRPCFDDMRKRIESGEANAIVCWQLNRLSRNAEEHGILQQLLQDEKIKAIYTSDRVYRPDDNALLFSVESGMSNQFIRELRANVKRGMRAKNKQGGINGVAPQGYLNNRADKTIVPDPKNFNLVRKAFDMYLTGNYSVPEIVKTMNEDWGFLTTKHRNTGNTPIARTTFYNMLKNPIYKGYVADIEDKEILHKGSWTPLITEEEYDRIQMLLATTQEGNSRHNRPRVAISAKRFELKGLFHCGCCGCSITAELKFKRLKDGSTKEYIYYHCTHKRPECTQKGNCRQEDLYAQIYDLLDSYTISPKLYEWGLKIIKDIQAKEIAERNDVHDMQNFNIESIQKQLDRLLDLVAKGIICEEDYETKARALKQSLSDMKQAQKDFTKRNKNWCEIVGKTLKLMQNPSNVFDNSTCLGDKRSVLQSLGYNHTLTDKKISFTPYPWVTRIKESAEKLSPKVKKVRTELDRIKNDPNEPLFTTWYAG